MYAPAPETIKKKQKRRRDKIPMHPNTVQWFAYRVTWRFGYARLIVIIARVTISVAS